MSGGNIKQKMCIEEGMKVGVVREVELNKKKNGDVSR